MGVQRKNSMKAVAGKDKIDKGLILHSASTNPALNPMMIERPVSSRLSRRPSRSESRFRQTKKKLSS